MKTVLITTTIRIPVVLELYREFAKDITFIITGDRKTSHGDVREFAKRIGNTIYLSDDDQEKLGYASSPLIGWNKIMRRNIALLEAMKLKPDCIITIDDDNIPADKDYFKLHEKVLGNTFSGPLLNSKSGWVNIGDFLSPTVYHRGFPYAFRNPDSATSISGGTGLKIGVSAGLWLGDPDIDAMERIVKGPMVMNFSDLLNYGGVAVSNQAWTPFNSQNTAYLAELAPLMMVLVGVGRFDDIWASFIAGRIMRELGYHVHFGQPYVWQERNQQNLIKNLKDEVYGIEHTLQFCNDLNSTVIEGDSIVDKLENLYKSMKAWTYLPDVVCELGLAWCADVKGIHKRNEA